MKFGRTYTMDIEGQTKVYTAAFPLTVSFNIERSTLASANKGHFTLYNLKESTRRDIYHDRYDLTTYRKVQIWAGYQSDATPLMIFRGNIIQAYSYRRGTDWLTEIDAFDGGFGILNGQVALTLPKGWTVKQSLQAVINRMPKLSLGAIGDFKTPNSRGLVLMGNAWDVVQRLAGSGVAFVDLETAHVIGRNEYLANVPGLQILNSESGLLNTPRRQDALIEVDMLFEPRAVVGQIVRVESIETVNNGDYQVIGVKHRGTISGAVGGEAVTTLSLWLGTRRLQGVGPVQTPLGAVAP